MNKLQELLASQSCILLDGGMGTMLFDAGLQSGDPPEEWNVICSEAVRGIHRDYIRAGSRVILTNSFGGTQYRLKLHNMHTRVAELNKAAAENARLEADQAPHIVVVAGSMGPTGELLDPMGTMTFAEAKAAFAEQAAALAEGGVDLLWVETMSDLNELKAAVEGARATTDLPIAATMSFDTRGHTMMGVSPAKAVEELKALNLVALGANCGNGLDEIVGVIQKMRQTDEDVILAAKANAGIPRWVGGELVYDGTPELMADYARQVQDSGTTFIGACCGSTPTHVAAMAAALGLPVLV